ncbi:hypothetical protein GBA65_22125 (plasmid) [Rubrobacter marinus]|uniref:Uncharacterized protein n=1 Tax=Rubrobacter marinus TaxID=2653852 RepID=A0A6G8Q3V6_9ACTN|nr:hypothetical protein [Rubrobacter marinus]QIN81133.1 hypothetical protein GBA65_22125 [Rubrobacter marinus]
MRGGHPPAGFGERVRLWLAAVLIDLGNWLSLDPAERRARRVWRRLEGRLAGLFGRRVALGLMGAGFVAPPVAEDEEEDAGAPSRDAARYLGLVVAQRRDLYGGRVELRCLLRCPAGRRNGWGRGAREKGRGEEEVALWEVARTPAALATAGPSRRRGGVISLFSRDHESALLDYYFDGFPRQVGTSPPEGGEPPASWASVPEWAPGGPAAREDENRNERRRNVIGELETKEAPRDGVGGAGPEERAAEEEGGIEGPTTQELLLAEQFAAEIYAEAASEGFADDPRAEFGLAGAYDIDEEDLWPGEAVFFGDAISSLADETAEEEIEEITA